MSLHKFFVENIKNVYASKCNDSKESVNEAADDFAIGSLTRNNILPQVFGGEYNGLRVPSAVIQNKAIPFWDKKYLTYPFVGINGYSDVPAIESKHGNEASFVSSKLKNIAVNSNVQSILAKQVSEGTGIAADNFLIFPQMPISSVGSRNLTRSMSLFTTYNKRDSYKNNLYPYNVQQALTVDANGNVVPDPNKQGGVILCTSARKSQMASNAILIASKLTEEDVANLAQLGDREVFASQFTGTAYAVPGGLLGSYMSGAKITNDLPNGNPLFGNFGKFATDNGFVTADGKIDFLKIRDWIKTSDALDIVKKLLIPYLLKSPYEKTYCWRQLTGDMKIKNPSLKDDIRLYNALNGREGSFEDNLEELSNDSRELDFENDEETEDGVSESKVEEASDDTKSIGGDTSRKDLIAVFNHYMVSHSPTFSFIPKERVSDTTRDDGRIVTKRAGIKRTFARIITKNTPMMDIDFKFCPKGLDSMLTSYSGVLDYSQLFDLYADILDGSFPKQFKFTRIIGYMISFEYDKDIEDAYVKLEGKGKMRSLGLLKYYMESPNSVKLREPTIFDVYYIKDKTYGNFIFSSYNTQPMPKNIIKAEGEPPACIDANRLYSDNVNGLHSFVVHDIDRVNMPTRYSKNVY